MHYTKVHYTSSNYQVTDADREFGFWLTKKRTSIIYLTKTCEVLTTFAKGYELFTAKVGATPKRRRALAGFYDFVSKFEEGLALLRKGDRNGYHAIWNACDFVEFIQDREFDDGYFFVEIGYRYPPKEPVGLYRLAEKASFLCRKFCWAFGYGKFPLNFLDPEVNKQRPEILDPLPKPTKTIIKTMDDVPISGIYLPLHPWGCPTYLIEGIGAPEATIPSGRDEDWESEADKTAGKPPVLISESFRDHSTKWTLLWKDDRYPNGHIPDESEYLDPSMEIPSDSLLPPEAKEEDFF